MWRRKNYLTLSFTAFFVKFLNICHVGWLDNQIKPCILQNLWHVGCTKWMIDFTNLPLNSISSYLKWKRYLLSLYFLCTFNWTHCPLLTNSTQTSFWTNLDYGHKHSQALTAIDLESLALIHIVSASPLFCSSGCPLLMPDIFYTRMPGCDAWEMDTSRFLFHSPLSIPDPTAISIQLLPQHLWLEL